MATGTITNVLLDPDNDPLVGIQVDARLTRTPASRIDNSTAVIPPESVTTNEDGEWTIDLEQSANLSPVNTTWVIHERIPYAQGGARFTMVDVIAGTRTLVAATVTSYTPPAADTYYTSAQINAIIGELVAEAIDEEIGTVIDDAVTEALVPFDGRLDDVESDVDALYAENDVQDATLTSLDGRMDAAEADITGKLDIVDVRVLPSPVGATDGHVPIIDSGSYVLGGLSEDGVTTFSALTDVDYSTPPTDGQVFIWDEGTSKLIPGDLPEGGGAVDSVNGETGVVVLDATDVDAAPDTLVATVTALDGRVDTAETDIDDVANDLAALAPGDIGAATSAQGALADSAVQPAAIADFVTGDGVTDIVALTQAAYDLLTPDATTLYVIIP
jgi:hypothetical protein